MANVYVCNNCKNIIEGYLHNDLCPNCNARNMNVLTIDSKEFDELTQSEKEYAINNKSYKFKPIDKGNMDVNTANTNEIKDGTNLDGLSNASYAFKSNTAKEIETLAHKLRTIGLTFFIIINVMICVLVVVFCVGLSKLSSQVVLIGILLLVLLGFCTYIGYLGIELFYFTYKGYSEIINNTSSNNRIVNKNICTNCGTKLIPGAKFCSKCGKAIL